MALISSARTLARPGIGLNRFRVYLGGNSKSSSLIRSFATTLRRKGGDEGWSYRAECPRPKKGSGIDIMATVAMTYIYWWMFWHMFTEPGHMFGGSRFGEFDYPEPTEWTDEELGIPPDNYEE